MKRNLFVKRLSSGIGALFLLPFSEVLAKPLEVSSSTKLNLRAFGTSKKTVKIFGQILDLHTNMNIAAHISLWKEHNMARLEIAQNSTKNFVIENELGDSFSEKIFFKISAPGYQTFEGYLSVSKAAVCIGDCFWQYNPNFAASLKPDNHREILDELHVDFNFHLLPLKL